MLGKSHVLASFFCVLVLSVLLFSALPVRADTDCSQLGAGYRPATADDAAVKNGQITVGTCYNPNASGISEQAEEAKTWLEQHAQSVSSCGTASQQSFEKLQSSFAVCAANALKKYEAAGYKFTISSAYRSEQQQVCVCGTAGPRPGVCGSAGAMGADGYAISCNGHWHQCGLALDINPSNGNYDQLHQFIQGLNDGVGFPIASTDKPHMQSTNPSQCGAGSTSGGIASGSRINNMQTGGLLRNLGSILAPPQPMQCPPGYMLMNGTCLPQQTMAQMQTTNPYSYLSSTPASSAIPASSVTPVTSVIPNTSGGSTNTNSNTNASSVIGNLGSNVMDNGNTSLNVSGMLDGGSQGSSGSSSSAIDLINQIANPTTTDNGSPNPQQATGTPVKLGSNLNDEVTLHGNPVSLNGSTQASTSYQLSPSASQTFVSQDLSKTPVNTYVPQQVNSTFTVLGELKQELLYIIAFFKPFGGVMPRNPVATASAAANNSTTAYME